MRTTAWLVLVAVAFGLGMLLGGTRPETVVIKRVETTAQSPPAETIVAAPVRRVRPSSVPDASAKKAAPGAPLSKATTVPGWPPELTDAELASVVPLDAMDGIPAQSLTLLKCIDQVDAREREILAAIEKLRAEKPPTDGEQVLNWPDGHLKSRGAWRGGKRVGHWQEWDESGQLVSEGDYDENGRCQGPWQHWRPVDAGYMHTEDAYLHGALDGPYVDCYLNGGKSDAGYFRAGKKEGLWQDWFESGHLRSSHEYHDDKAVDGPDVTYFDNGQMEQRAVIKNGSPDGLVEDWYENGEKEDETSYQDGLRSGVERRWNDRGVLTNYTEYKAGNMNGVNRYWADSGNLLGEEHYVDHKHEGVSTYYSETVANQKVAESTYVNGVMQGTARGWHEENGKPAYVQQYVDGLLEGTATTWRIDGSKESEGKYHKDKPDGDMVFYRADGVTVDHVEHWKDGKQVP